MSNLFYNLQFVNLQSNAPNLMRTLRPQGVGWKRIAAEMGVGVGTIYRVALDGSKIREKVF